MPAGRTVLVLGGGVGGIVAATRLRKRLPAADRVVLIERERQHAFQPSLLWLAVGNRTPEAIQRPLERLAGKGIEIVTGEITTLDAERKQVRVDGATLEGDAIVISLGAELDTGAVPGLASGGHNLYTLEGAVAARDALQQVRGGRVVLLTAAPVYKCPAAPYEAAMLVHDRLQRRGVEGAAVELIAAEAGPMGTAGPEVSMAVRGMVEARGISYRPNHQIERVDPSARTLHFTSGATAEYDLLIYVPPHRAPKVVRDAGLVGESGWIAVDAANLGSAIPGVFAIGDVTSIPIPSGKALPKAGVFAHAQAEVVADNLAAEWTGLTPDRVFDGKGGCFIETGAGRAGYGAGNFYASPAPELRLHPPSVKWHLAKVLFEKHWLWKWFPSPRT
jgi:sulfide:quinone oxidoreductase